MKDKYKKLLSIFVIIFICTITVGYAAFGTELSISNIVAQVRIQKDVRITGVKVANTSYSIINSLDYDSDSIIGNVNFEDTASYFTLEVSVTNFGNTTMGIYDITGLSSDLYSQISNYEMRDKLCDSNGNCTLGTTATFNITIEYDYSSDGVGEYDIKLDFDFREIYSVKYTDITNNDYPSYVMSGDTLNVTFTTDIPSKIEVYSNGDLIDSSMYSYSDGSLVVNDVSGDIEIKECDVSVARVVSGDLTTSGSEVCIEDECFYIISNDGTTVSMLAKYNLYVGNYTSDTEIEGLSTNSNQIQTSRLILNDDNYKVSKLYAEPVLIYNYFPLSNPTYIQDEVALGYVTSGDTFIGVDEYSASDGYLAIYKEYLEMSGANILTTRNISIDELETLGCNYGTSACGDGLEWLYTTTYWVNLSSSNSYPIMYSYNRLTEISNSPTEAGFRPVIEMAADEIRELFTFMIVNTTYQALEDMTWKEWIESDFNTVGLTYNAAGEVQLVGADLLKNGSSVFSNDLIESGVNYTYGNTHSGGSN